MFNYLLIFLVLVLFAFKAAAEEKLVLQESLDTEFGTITFPLELYLDDPTDTELAIKLAGNLGSLQGMLPRILSDVVVNECDRRIGLEMQEAHAEGDAIRVRGRVQIIFYTCNKAMDFDSRILLVSNITQVDALLRAGIDDDCLGAEIDELSIDPSGIIGGIMNLTGITQTLSNAVRTEVNETLNQQDNCIDLPEPLQVMETRIREAGFRDFGGGTIGFVLKASVESKSGNLIKLFLWLEQEGVLDGKDCECEQGG